jgi:membrane protein DedA with SNARE-associated domain
MGNLFDILLNFSSELGYWGIVVLMTVESSFVPFPSEIVIPPAAFLAAQGEMNIWLIILAGLVGSLTGAMINYILARTLGRTIVYSIVRHRHAKWLLLSEAKLEQSEAYFRKYGGISTFIGRLIPAVRQLISIPAGFSQMKIPRFLFYTTLGASTWTIVLALVGYFFGAYLNEIMEYWGVIKHVIYGLIVVAVIGLGVWYFKYQKSA